MDPIEALNRIRHAIECYRAVDIDPTGADKEDEAARDSLIEHAESIVEHFEALDGWMTRGGFLPTQWALKRGAADKAERIANFPPMRFYRNLDDSEAEAFRVWARENYKPTHPIDGTWHPVVQAECLKMNVEWASASA